MTPNKGDKDVNICNEFDNYMRELILKSCVLDNPGVTHSVTNAE